MGDVTVRVLDLPCRVKGLTLEDDVDYVVLINSRLNAEQQHAAYLHELIHIEKGDFNKDPDLIELVRHAI